MMDDSVLAIIGFIAALVALDVAALRFGVDSRRLTREQPRLSESAVRVSPDIHRHPRGRQMG